MLTSAQFLAAADRAGMLKTATWQPSAGGPLQTAQVDLLNPDVVHFGGAVIATETTATYADTSFIGLTEGETLTIAGVDYRVRTPKLIQDGSVMQATLAKP